MGEPGSFLVVGLGNEFRGDDGCGPLVARLVDQKRCPGVRVLSSPKDDTELIMEWGETQATFIIDCVRSGSSAGSIFRFEPLAEVIPEKVFRPTSSHRLGITQITRLAQALGRLPRLLIVYGIEGDNFDHGTEMTPAVTQVARDVAGRIVSEIVELTRQTSDRSESRP